MKRLIAFYISKRKKALIIIGLMIPLLFLLLLLMSLLSHHLLHDMLSLTFK
jgi:hypothetical protein